MVIFWPNDNNFPCRSRICSLFFNLWFLKILIWQCFVHAHCCLQPSLVLLVVKFHYFQKILSFVNDLCTTCVQYRDGEPSQSTFQTLDIANTGRCNHSTRADSLSVNQSVCPFQHFVWVVVSDYLRITYMVQRKRDVWVRIFFPPV